MFCVWFVFNVVFICGYQHFLLWLLSRPACLASQGDEELNAMDAVACSCFVFFLVVESVADNQQWAFQQSKRGKAKKNPNLLADYKRGFLSSSGLFKYSRHPNFLAEQCIWFSFYLFSVASLQGGVPSKLSGWFNATIAGPALLSLLFQGSARFTEVISCEKYPEYRHYQATTGMFF